MDLVSAIALATGMGWASGIRLYATVCLFGVLARSGMIHLPAQLDVLSSPWLIALSGLLCLVEFIADKFPLVDSMWDSVHTFIRIPSGALLSMGAIGSSDPVVAASVALLGGTLAGGAHFAKAGSRALINASPEPFSNLIASFIEEGLVAAGLWLTLVHPALFLVFLALFTVAVIWLLPKLLRGVKQVLSVIR